MKKQLEVAMKYKIVRTWKAIQQDPRIEQVIWQYDGPGKHSIECKDGWKFEGERTQDIGTVAELCDAVNFNLEEASPSPR